MNLTNNTCNHEIEDYVYPEIICYLVNKLLQKKSFNTIDIGLSLIHIYGIEWD